MAVTTPFGAVIEIIDGLAIRQRYWTDQGKALEAAGLRGSAMWQENVEVVRRLVAPWDGAADFIPMIRDEAPWTRYRAEIAAILVPDCVFTWIAPGQPIREGTGLEDFRQGWLDWTEPWESLRGEIDRMVPVGDKVVALARQHGRLAGSDNEVELIGAAVYLMRNGRVARAEFYANRTEALETVGLRE